MRIIQIRSFLFVVSFMLFGATCLQAQNMTTIAGGLGDGGMATAIAQLNQPTSIAQDAIGNIYVGDGYNFCIRKIAPSGVHTILAGTGENGYGGDGGPATAAKLKTSEPGLAVDGAGNVYIADETRIRKVSASGIITTVAGNGVTGYSGDGGPATLASITYTRSIAIDRAGNLYLSNGAANVIRKVNTSGIISTIAGTGTAGYSGDGGPATAALLNDPIGIAVDTSGNIYFCEYNNYVIRKIDNTGTISTYAGNASLGYSGDGGPATTAKIGFAFELKINRQQELIIPDYGISRVRKVNTAGVISTIAGNGAYTASGDGGPATAAGMSPADVLCDTANNIWLVDYVNSRLRKIDASGIIGNFAGPGNYGGDGGPATSATLYRPAATAVDGAGNLFIADMFNNAIRKVDRAGIITTIAGNGSNGYGGDGGPATAAQLNHPVAVAADRVGNVYVSDSGNHRLRKISTGGGISTIAGNGSAGYGGDGGPATAAQLNQPNGLRVDGSGNIYFADMANNCVRKINSSGAISTIVGTAAAGYGGDGGPATAAQLNKPTGVALDPSGNLYISEAGNNCIRMVNPSGNITTIAGNGAAGYGGDGGPATAAQMSAPAGVTIDNVGNMLIADGSNYRIRMISTAGTIATMAGSGSSSYGGDGGPATAASFSAYRVATDTTGYMYVSDLFNNRIRKLRYRIPAGVPTITNISTIELTALPNPAKTMVTLMVPGNWSEGELTIYNSNGQLATMEEIKNDRSGNISIALSHLAPGWYVAHLTTNTGQYFAKVLVER